MAGSELGACLGGAGSAAVSWRKSERKEFHQHNRYPSDPIESEMAYFLGLAVRFGYGGDNGFIASENLYRYRDYPSVQPKQFFFAYWVAHGGPPNGRVAEIIRPLQ